MAYGSQGTCVNATCSRVLGSTGLAWITCKVLGANHKCCPLFSLAGACSPDEARQKLLALLTALETLVTIHLRERAVMSGKRKCNGMRGGEVALCLYCDSSAE